MSWNLEGESPVQPASTDYAISAGCDATRTLKRLIVDLDAERLAWEGEDLVWAMSHTGDGALDGQAGLIGFDMVAFSELQSGLQYDAMMGSIDSYLYLCETRGY